MKRPAAKSPDEPRDLNEPEPEDDDPPKIEEKGKRAKAKTSKPLPVESNDKPPAKKEVKAEVISTESCKGGWQILTHQTASGRTYKKWVSPDGKFFYSTVKAEANGFEGQIES